MPCDDALTGTTLVAIKFQKKFEGHAMFERGNELADIDGTCVSDDGQAIGMRFHRADGSKFDLWCEVGRLNDVFCLLGSLAKAAGEQRGGELPLPPLTQNETTPIPAIGVGFQVGAGPDDIRLLIQLHGFDMAFQVPRSELAGLAAALSRTASTLSADPSQKN